VECVIGVVGVATFGSGLTPNPDTPLLHTVSAQRPL
jgi:hypothetical protein